MSTNKPNTIKISNFSALKRNGAHRHTTGEANPYTADAEPQTARGVGTRRCSVLIVDPLEESREVLRTALERRGMTIIEASGHEQGLELAEQLDPDLIVVDLELEGAPNAVSEGFEQQSRSRNRPLIMLGEVRRRDARRLDAQIIAKPYHYGPLIRKIEELVAERHRPVSKAG